MTSGGSRYRGRWRGAVRDSRVVLLTVTAGAVNAVLGPKPDDRTQRGPLLPAPVT